MAADGEYFRNLLFGQTAVDLSNKNLFDENIEALARELKSPRFLSDLMAIDLSGMF